MSEEEPIDVVDQLVEEARGGGRKKRRNKEAAEKPAEVTSEVPTFKDFDELDAARVNADRPLPQPEENVRTLDDLMAKYHIGSDHDFYVEVYRIWPKMFPGGTPAEGLYDTYQQPLTQEFIQSEYGGGRFRVVIKGPRPNGEPGQKHYASMTFNLAGDPNVKRLPRAVQAQKARDEAIPLVGPIAVSGGLGDSNPKLVEKAFEVLTEQLSSEKVERHRLEDSKHKGSSIDETVLSKLAEAHERRAEDVSRSARDQLDHERKMYEDKLKEERDRFRVLEDRVTSMQNQPAPPQIDFGDTFQKMAGVFKDSDTTQKVLDQVLSKHKEELQAIRESHQREIDAMRAGHASEMQMLRESNTRMMEAERHQADSRVQRIEDQLKMERDERRRDRERWDEQLKDRELQARDRQQSAIDSVNAQSEARFNTMRTSLENRIEFLNGEIDRLRREIEDYRVKDVEVRDPVAQMQKAKDMAEIARGMFGGGNHDVTGGIGGSHEEGGMGKLFEKVGENFPGILDAVGRAFNSGGGGQQQQQQPQIVMTPQGPAQVVNTPQGQILLPIQGMGAPGPQQLPRNGGNGGRRVMPDENELLDVQERRERHQQKPQPKSRTSRVEQPQSVPQQAPVQNVSDVEKMALKEIVKLIDESVMSGDEIEEFVEKVVKGYPEPVLRQVLSYDVMQFFHTIAALPETKNSAALSPGGQRFVKDAFYALRKTMGME